MRDAVISLFLALAALAFAACNRGSNQEAVRQGVIDHLAEVGIDTRRMDVNVTSVQFNGNQAEATVSFTPKGGTAAQGMSMRYTLQQQGGKWVVTGRHDAGGTPHGGGAMPGMANPHGGAQMPAPEELPPVKKP